MQKQVSLFFLFCLVRAKERRKGELAHKGGISTREPALTHCQVIFGLEEAELDWFRGFPVEVGLFFNWRELGCLEIAFFIASLFGSFLERESGHRVIL